MLKPLCIIGPTASGKNNLALELKSIIPNIHIINVDSAQIYQELSIGANKPTTQELSVCPHHLYGYKSVKDDYDVSVFLADLNTTLNDIKKNKGFPVLVGGTMMYYHQLFNGLVSVPPLDKQQVAQWREQHVDTPLEVLYSQLKSCDYSLYQKIKPQDRQRIERALIVFALTGKPLSAYQIESQTNSAIENWSVVKLTYRSRDYHRQVIKMRLDKMMEQGFLYEVKSLWSQFNDQSLPFWKYVGYRQLRPYLDGHDSFDKALEKVYFSTCQLAKRQKTWMKKFEGLTIEVDSPGAGRELESYVQSELDN